MVFKWKLKLKPKPDSFWELKIPLQDVQRLNNTRLIAYFPENRAYDELFMRFDVSWLVFMFWRSQRITRSVAGSCHTLRSTKWNWTLDRLEILLYIATITLDILFCNVWVCVCFLFTLLLFKSYDARVEIIHTKRANPKNNKSIRWQIGFFFWRIFSIIFGCLFYSFAVLFFDSKSFCLYSRLMAWTRITRECFNCWAVQFSLCGDLFSACVSNFLGVQ